MTWQTQAILSALLEEPSSPHYGLELAKAAGLPTGTIYPTLARLEKSGWIESEVEQIDPKVAGRRARRYYKLTGVGERLARAEIAKTVDRLQKRTSSPGVQRRPGMAAT